MKAQKGFTLLEVVIVLLILAALLAVAVGIARYLRPSEGMVVERIVDPEIREWTHESECARYDSRPSLCSYVNSQGGVSMRPCLETYCRIYRYWQQEHIYPLDHRLVTQPDPEKPKRFSVWVRQDQIEALAIGDFVNFDELQARYERAYRKGGIRGETYR